ncbi:hypothetical protein [Streptomyces coelicoflavus]|uniref:hypothetical protein n=1 Tax=Streptomyces coelicoflavus TaxID=285562 RepID=UPI003F49EE18
MTEQSDTPPDGPSRDSAAGAGPEQQQDDSPLAWHLRDAEEALAKLGASDPELAGTLARLLSTVATEAGRTPRFARALGKALVPPGPGTAPRPAERPRRSSRRAPGVIDPFAVFAEGDEAGLRSRLGELSLEQLRDIISEHGMDHDRLAMKWKAPERVIDRIVERVQSRTAKGAAFRGRPEHATPRHDEAGGPTAETSPQ